MNWREFQPVLEVLRGGPRANPDLADWIAARYGVAVVDVVEDEIRLGPRLSVWVRTSAEKRSFDAARGGFDRAKQRAVGEAAGRPGIFVIFVSVDQELRERTLGAAALDYSPVAAAALDDPSTLWKAYALFGQLFVFLLTDAQAQAIRGTPQAERVTDALWAHARTQDEFDILLRESLHPVFDSKQNLDENYEGSAYYYHR